MEKKTFFIILLLLMLPKFFCFGIDSSFHRTYRPRMPKYLIEEIHHPKSKKTMQEDKIAKLFKQCNLVNIVNIIFQELKNPKLQNIFNNTSLASITLKKPSTSYIIPKKYTQKKANRPKFAKTVFQQKKTEKKSVLALIFRIFGKKETKTYLKPTLANIKYQKKEKPIKPLQPIAVHKKTYPKKVTKPKLVKAAPKKSALAGLFHSIFGKKEKKAYRPTLANIKYHKKARPIKSLQPIAVHKKTCPKKSPLASLFHSIFGKKEKKAYRPTLANIKYHKKARPRKYLKNSDAYIQRFNKPTFSKISPRDLKKPIFSKISPKKICSGQ